MQLRLKESVGDTFTATFRAADVPMDVTSNPPFAKELIVPFWLVRSTADENLANMGRSTLKCTCSITAGGEESKGDTVLIPILHNTKARQEGDELLVYSNQQVTPAVSIEPMQPPGKRSASTKPLKSRPKKMVKRK